jgi:hypothetical protein
VFEGNKKDGILMRALVATALALLLATSVGLASRPAHEAEAQLLPYRLNGGPYNRYVTININPAVSWSWYNSSTQNAIASWNLAQTSSGQYVVSFLQTANWYISALDYHANNYGFTEWRGATVPFKSNGTMATQCVAWCLPTSNWDYAELRLNNSYMMEDISLGQPLRSRNTAAHEFGHGIALHHNSSQTTLMYAYIWNYDLSGIYSPQPVDIQWAWSAYH